MKKLYIYLSVLIILVLLVIGFAALFDPLNIQHEIVVGESVFTIPDGYHKAALNSNGDKTITNNINSISIKEYNGDISQTVNSYNRYKKSNHYPITIKKFQNGNISGYKSTISNETNIHYWFAFNGKTYCIYTWDDDNIDNIAMELMKTVKSK